jgi:hypothetical protein
MTSARLLCRQHHYRSSLSPEVGLHGTRSSTKHPTLRTTSTRQRHRILVGVQHHAQLPQMNTCTCSGSAACPRATRVVDSPRTCASGTGCQMCAPHLSWSKVHCLSGLSCRHMPCAAVHIKFLQYCMEIGSCLCRIWHAHATVGDSCHAVCAHSAQARCLTQHTKNTNHLQRNTSTHLSVHVSAAMRLCCMLLMHCSALARRAQMSHYGPLQAVGA